ncbi:MAG TPA: hypothetical protein IAA56_02040 [Candidatus Galloscillospira excrementavium]|nr:hypothetical protein [Candidatus Galloscillospira excrementavium]
MKRNTMLLPLLLCLALLAGCTGTPGAAGTDTPAPTATETAGPVPPTPDPTAEPTAAPTPALTPMAAPEPTAEPTAAPTPAPTPTAAPEPTAEPTSAPTPEPTTAPATPAPTVDPALLDFPLSEEALAQPVPEFLDEEQQTLYRRAYDLYCTLFAADTYAIGSLGGGEPEEGSWEQVDGEGRHRAGGNYARWADFDALVHSVFTDRFWQEKNNSTSPAVYGEKDGELYYLDFSFLTDPEYNPEIGPTFTLLDRTDDEIYFQMTCYYVDPYRPDLMEKGPDERAAWLKSHYEYTITYPMLLVRTGAGWRFDEFRHGSLDGAAFQWPGPPNKGYTYLGPGEYVGKEYADARSKLILRHLDVINTPLDELPREILDELVPTGEEEHLLETEPGWVVPWVVKTYTAPHMVLQTVRLDHDEHLEEMFAGMENGQESYDLVLEEAQAQGGVDREFIYSICLLDDTCALETGLRVGDSLERAEQLGYDGLEDGNESYQVAFERTVVYVENGVVTEILVTNWGRSCGNIWY